MFVCFCCGEIFEDDRILFDHIQKFHSDCTEYQCSVPTCYRVYSSYNCLKKVHMRKHKRQSIHKIANIELPSHSQNSIDDFASPSPIFNKNTDSEKIEVFDEYVECPDDEFYDAQPSIVSQIATTKINSTQYDLPINDSEENLNLTKNDFPNILRNYENLVHQRSLFLASKLYSLPDLSRKRTEMIIKDHISFVNNTCFSLLRSTIINCLEQSEENSENKSRIQQMFKILQDSFNNFQSSYRSFKFFADKGTFIKPIHLNIGYRNEYKIQQGSLALCTVPLTAEFIPLRTVLEKFFQTGTILEDTLAYLNLLNNTDGIISNYVQGSYWKAFMKSKEKIIIPVALYFDDYENNNPLGSHRGIQKCGAVYFLILCLPPKYRSKLESIFLFLLTNTLDRKLIEKNKIFSTVIEELKFLESTGITININGKLTHIYFKLAVILGDNLAVNELFGLVESFSANHFCRFCLINKKDINSVFSEKLCTLRDRKNYKYGLSLNIISKTGIKEMCCFHSLPDFHFTENIAVDIMHDFYEGVCQYNLALIFNHFISNSFFSLNKLNTILVGYLYSFHDRQNKPPRILNEHLKNKQIILSAAEMQSLLRNLTLMIGHLIPEDSEHWELILKLVEISEIITANYYQPGHCDLLECIIDEYLTTLTNLFPNSIKPKHHFLIHYPRVMKLSGPLRNLSCMRGESKNKESKQFSDTAINRINICYTIATKHQLKLNHYLQSFLVPQDFLAGPIKQSQSLKIMKLLFPDIFSSEEISELNWLKFNDQYLSQHSIIIDPTEDGPRFYIVKNIFLDQNKIKLVTQHVTAYLDKHFHAFNVLNYSENYKIFFWEELKNLNVSHKLRAGNGEEYIVKRWI